MAENWWECPLDEIKNEGLELVRSCTKGLRLKLSDEARGKMFSFQNLRPTNHNFFFLGTSSANDADRRSGHQGLVNPNVNIAGFDIFN